ncbi:ABC transporter family substrate-binding protein [Nonomuraea ferruginea]|uniref:ABC transporter family substrate-binding protein n=1 Tax=Nonomuraea ferruginea TaxID=46174 RepID=A0ABT4T975_9ACTN|nr:ABC transporter family substrate-binding protein [Nonomuraea ferruginea]MDA0646063.1 ABC transporter family substrate-binding protein [Nonomuraea ferruginea]
MKAPLTGVRLVVAAVLALTQAGCGTRGPSAGAGQGDDTIKASDINLQPRDKVKEGGTLRWGINEFPTQWNRNHIDGNLAVAAVVSNALLPSAFTSDGNARLSVNRDYVLEARITDRSPHQVVTYTLNPKARWSDGKPITWADYRAQWEVMRGADPAFRIVSATGYQDIAKVERGAGEHEVVVTFTRPFGDWQALFGPLLPASVNENAEAFNSSWVNAIPLTAGPFKVGALDQTAKTVTLVRDPAWWGDRAKLDRIVYRAAEQDSLTGMFGNGELDVADIGPSAPDYARARSATGAQVRLAAGPDFRHFTLNGSSEKLRDVRVRQAIQLGVDRMSIARSDLQGLDWPATPLGNHFFMPTQEGYRDNAGSFGAYDPERAKRLLDEAGWKLDGTVRKKAGDPLDLRFVVPAGSQLSKSEGELAQSMLAKIGVKLTIQAVPGDDFFTKYVIPGDFDIAPFAYIGTPFPVSSSYGAYVNSPDGKTWNANLGRSGSDDIDAALDRAVAALDPARARAAVNAADRLIWAQANVLPLYQRPQVVAVKDTLANVGARGFHDLRYQDIGFTR